MSLRRSGTVPVGRAESGTSRFSARLEAALGIIVAVTLFFMMWVTFIDVAMRKVLPGAFPAADELTKLSLGVLVFAALPLITARREHVVISLFDGLFSKTWNAVKLSLIDLVSAVLLSVLAWRLAGLALRQGEYGGDRLMFLDVPISPLTWFACIAAALSAVIALGLALGRLWRRSDPA